MCVCCAFSIERERSFKQTLADYRQQDFRWSPRVIPIILLDGNKANRSSSFAQASVEDARTDPIFHVSIVQTRDRNRRWRDAEGTDANTRDPSRPYELLSFLWNIAKKKVEKGRQELHQEWRAKRMEAIFELLFLLLPATTVVISPRFDDRQRSAQLMTGKGSSSQRIVIYLKTQSGLVALYLFETLGS